MGRKKQESLGNAIISGLKEIADYKQGKIDLRTTTVALPKPPKPLTKKQIKDLREKTLGVSQSIFAMYLGVSGETIKAWEQGKTSPKGPALRMLHAAKKDKDSFLDLISA